MPTITPGRYERGSAHERAHRLLESCDVDVDHVWVVDVDGSGQGEIAYTYDSRAHTAVVEYGDVVLIRDGWDVVPPTADPATWSGP